MPRLLMGVSIGSSLEGVDAAIVRIDQIGLEITPQVVKTLRVVFPPATRDQLLRVIFRVSSQEANHAVDLVRPVADTALHAVRTVVNQARCSPRDLFALGFLAPGQSPAVTAVDWLAFAERVAEQSGLTLIHGFRGRDQAVGGCGHPITAAADYLAYRSRNEARIVIHLGTATHVSVFYPETKLSNVMSYDVGPGTQWLDSLVYHGTRGREYHDIGGKKAVQGCSHEPLLSHWLDHPYLSRRPPKTLHPDAFGRSFLLAAFDTARSLDITLPDLLCTGTHLVATIISEACRSWLAECPTPGRIFVSGSGVRNGLLMQLLHQRITGTAIEPLDAIGVPALARHAVAAAILAAMTCDGVPGNLPHLTGASAGRILGQFLPGDSRNWTRCVNWLTEHCVDLSRFGRAA